MKTGDIALDDNDSFFRKLVRFFSSGQYSHTYMIAPALGLDPLETFKPIELAAMEINGFKPALIPMRCKQEKDNRTVYFRPCVSHETKLRALNKTWDEHAKEFYGYTIFLWFVYSYIIKKVTGKNPRRANSWFSSGMICSEYVAAYIINLGGEFATLFNANELSTYTPSQIFDTLDKRADLFKRVGQVRRGLIEVDPSPPSRA